MKKTVTILFLFLVPLVGCEKEADQPKLACMQPDFAVNQTVLGVKNNSNAVVGAYKFDDVIEAYVVSSDQEGNFFKSITFQTRPTLTEPAIGFSIPVDASSLYTDYRVGNKVYIKLKNLQTDLLYGGLRLGRLYVSPYNQGGVGRLSQNEYKTILNASCTTIKEDKLVNQATLSTVLTDANLNTLIELSGVQFTAAAQGRNYYEPTNDVGGATNWNLQDQLGNQVIFRTSSYANFANNKVPSGSGKVRGILTKYSTDYQLVARFEKDLELNKSRTTPFFMEDFELVANNVKINLPGWANLLQKGTKSWIGTIDNGNGYAEFNTTNTKGPSVISWLVSPKINMDVYTNEVLTFRAAQHDLVVDVPQNTLEVYVSANFDGLNVATATWTKLLPILPKQATPKYQFIGSGALDLSIYKGKINIAFKYIGSGDDPALGGAFLIDDVQIYGNK